MTAGSVYLAASHSGDALHKMSARALAAVTRTPARVAVTYAAADAPLLARMLQFFERLFPGAGVKRFTVEGEKHPMLPADARAIVADADIVFLSGGDPVHGARILVDAGADEWLREAHARGAACVGVSAGAIMLGATWAEWPDHPPHGAPHEGGELVTCTRVLPDLVVDCHAEDDDWNELRLVRDMLVMRPGGDDGLPRLVGLPSGSGIVVSPDGEIEAIGRSPYRLR